MKRFLSGLLAILISGAALALASNLSVADDDTLLLLQVFDKGKFVETLNLSDFEVFTGEKLLEVKGLSLIKGLKEKRKEGAEIKSAILPRVIVLEFRGYEYDQKLGQMVEHLFRRPYSPSDTISLVTPVNVYGFFSESLRDRTPEELINAGSSILKRDLSVTGKTENEIIQELTRLVLDLQQGSSAKETLMQYQQNLESLKNIRKFNTDTLLVAAGRFSEVRALKHYVIIYQQEFLPIPNSEMMDSLLANRSIMFQASELFRSIPSDESVNLEPIIEELRRSGIVVDFIYFKTNPRPRPDIQLRELSTDMFDIYSKMAYATGGFVGSSATPSAQLKKILENTENYYLISYAGSSGENLEKPSSGVKARIKNKDYELTYVKL
ncbi:MAG: hypothetical protein ACPLRA_04685 [Candidatus Saccharicenans sp.]